MRSFMLSNPFAIVCAFLLSIAPLFSQNQDLNTPTTESENAIVTEAPPTPEEIGVVPTNRPNITDKEIEEQRALLGQMFSAVSSGNTEEVEKMMQEGRVDYYRHNESGETALTQAIVNDNLDLVKILTKEAIINLKNDEGETPLTLAIKKGNMEVIYQVLKRAKASLKNDAGEAPLYLALANNDLHLLQQLIKGGADVNRKSNGLTVLSQAVELNNYRAVGYLIRNGAVVNQANDNGDIPLYVAIKNGYDVITGILVNKSEDPYSDVNWKNPIGDPLLNIAAHNGNIEIIRMLIEAGASVNELDTEENTPLHIAAANGQDKAVTLIMTYEADINARNLRGATPLMLAGGNTHKNTYTMLIEYGANDAVKDYMGYVAEDYMAGKVTEVYRVLPASSELARN